MKGTARRMLLLAVTTAGLFGVIAPARIASVPASAQAPASKSAAQAQTATIQAVFTGGRAKTKIVCAIAVSKPNYETPSHRKVATAGVVACSSRVVGIAFSFVLTKDLRPVAKRGFASLGSKRKVGDVSYSCPTNRTHRYGGVMFGTVVFPPGYEPHTGSFAVASGQAHLRCR